MLNLTSQSWWQSPLDVILDLSWAILYFTFNAITYITPHISNNYIDHGLEHKPVWQMFTIPRDRLIPLGTSCRLCVLIKLNPILHFCLINLVPFLLS
jgi:hypothetical protein